MRIIHHQGLTYLQFEHLAACAGVSHAIFTRRGGVSRGPYASLNISFAVGDDPACVAVNRRTVAGVFPGAALLGIRQVHGTDAVEVPAAAFRSTQAEGIVSGDALMTRADDAALMIKTADCQSVMLFDPVQNVVANIHSGWRGSVGNIIGSTVRAMATRFDTRPADLVAGIGPSLGPCCAEFVNFRQEIPRHLWDYKDGGDHFNFWALSRDQLVDAGVVADRIETSGLCTRCRPDLFFSYRGEGVTGRFAAVIAAAHNGTAQCDFSQG
jgi:hypothetical protein